MENIYTGDVKRIISSADVNPAEWRNEAENL